MWYTILFLHNDNAPADIWNEFYERAYDGNKYTNCENCNVSAKQAAIYVYQSIYHDLSNGSISISSVQINFLHSSCFFDECFKKGKGGAIYFECESSIVQHRFCTTNTYIENSHGFHSFVNVGSNDFEKQNCIIESTIANCKDLNSYSLIYSSGYFGLSSANFSHNQAYAYSDYTILSSDNPQKIKINYSTFENNYAQSTTCLYHSNGLHELYKNNIVNNSQNQSIHGIIRAYAKSIVTIKICTILRQNGNGKLFSADNNGKLYLQDCYVDSFDANVYTNEYDVATFRTNRALFNNSLNDLPHLSSFNCMAKIKLSTKSKSELSCSMKCSKIPTKDKISKLFIIEDFLVISNQ